MDSDCLEPASTSSHIVAMAGRQATSRALMLALAMVYADGC